MTSISTIDQLIEKLFGEDYLAAFNQVDMLTDSPNEDSVTTLDELGNTYLGKGVDAAFPDVDLKEERIGVEFTIREFNLRVGMQGLSLILTVIFLAALILGSSVVLAILQTMLRT